MVGLRPLQTLLNLLCKVCKVGHKLKYIKDRARWDPNSQFETVYPKKLLFLYSPLTLDSTSLSNVDGEI